MTKTKRELWNEVYKAADQVERTSDGFFQFTMSAEEEANVMAASGEFDLESEEYGAYCIRHLESLLSYTDNAKAVAFFTDLGIQF